MDEWKQKLVTGNSECGLHYAYSVGSVNTLFGIAQADEISIVGLEEKADATVSQRPRILV